MRVYLVYSFSQASPWPPEALGYPYVLVSADDIMSAGLDVSLSLLRAVRNPPKGWLLVDSGGFRVITKGELPDPREVLDVQRVVAEEVDGFPVLLDVPVRKPLRASTADCKAANHATAKNSVLWQKAFGDSYLYPIHVCDLESLEHALEILRKTHQSVEAIGLGSLAPIAARSPRRVVELVAIARENIDRWLHVFGVGNGVAALIAQLELADSIDTASHIIDASFGMARHPISMLCSL